MVKLIDKTVFHPIGKEWKPDKVLAVLFHRSAAILYFIYFLWGTASIFGSIPTLVRAQGDMVQTIFSMLVAPIAFIAFVGASYFPRFARMEMYAASALVTLVVIYECFVSAAFLEGDAAHGVAFILNLSHLVIPISRIIFIYVTLMKQAGGKNV